MKWAIIAVFGLVVLGGIGYLVYELTDAPERAQQAWDEARLNNFETIANRELADFEKKISEYEATLNKLRTDHIQWAGHPSYDGNTKQQPHGFLTALGYEIEIAFLSARGKSLAAAYRQASQAEGAQINADTGQLDESVSISANVLTRNDSALAKAIAEGKDPAEVNFNANVRQISAGDILSLLHDIETNLIEHEANRDRIGSIAKEYAASITEWEQLVKASKEQLQEMRKEVAQIAAEIKLQKAREDLDELNRSIRGESTDSKLGTMIHNFENRRDKFQREQLVRGDQKAAETPTRTTLADLDSPATSQPTRTSRFLD
jgi:hypothetical protein